eukprot:10394868-Alexandrium_andersonii.AAC.1
MSASLVGSEMCIRDRPMSLSSVRMDGSMVLSRSTRICLWNFGASAICLKEAQGHEGATELAA